MIRQLTVDQPLDLATTLHMGQDFRWYERDDGWHSGVLSGNLIHIRRTELGVEYKSDSNSDLTQLLASYFRLDDDIEAIYADLSSHDDRIAMLVQEHYGLRLLRQAPWECTVAYICSANAGVDKIRMNVEAIAGRLGHPVSLGDDVRHTFPSYGTVFEAEVEPLEELKLGLSRLPPYIFAAARRICSGYIDLVDLAYKPYTETIRELKVFDGIGNKSSNCIALFAMDSLEAFPVDRNIGRSLAGWYDDCPMPKDLSRLTDKRYDKHYTAIVDWAWERFGEYAGYASQFLFHEQRLGSSSNPS